MGYYDKKYSQEEMEKRLKEDPKAKNEDIPINFHHLTPHETKAFYEQIASKLKRLCDILSRDKKVNPEWDNFKVDWSQNGIKTITSANNAVFTFQVDHNNFVFKVMPGHFQIESLHQQTGDWRKKKPFSHSYDLLQPFYAQIPENLFLDPKLSQKSLENVTSFWKHKTEPFPITFPLRFGYKLYGGQIEDGNAQIQITNILNALPKSHEKHHPLVENFAQSLLVEKLRKKDPARAQLFAFEFGLTQELVLGNISYEMLEKMKLGRILEIVNKSLEKNHQAIKGTDKPILSAIIDSSLTRDQKISSMTNLLNHPIKIVDYMESNKPHSVILDVLRNMTDNDTITKIIPLVTLLIHKGADVNAKVEGVPLLANVISSYKLNINGQIQMMTLLLNQGAKPQDYIQKQYEPHSIIWDVIDKFDFKQNQERILPLLSLLAEKGADMNATVNNVHLMEKIIDHYSFTINNKIKLIELFLKHGAKLSDYQGKIIQKIVDIVASHENKNEILPLLSLIVTKGDNVHAKVGDIGLIAYVINHHTLEMGKKIEIVDLLLNQGCKTTGL